MGDIKTDGGTENIEVFKQEKGNDSLPNGNVEDGLIKETLAENKEPESSKEENESSKKDQLVESGESEDSEKVEPTEYLKRLRSRTSRTTRSSRSSSIELKKDDTPLSTRDSKSDESGVISNLGTPSDEEDFLGFDCPNTTRRDAFLKLIGKKNDVPEKESTNQENMLEIVNDENPLSVESDGISSDSVSKRPLVSKSSKKPASAIINDPKFKKPFEYGWMRELVYRSSGESGLKRSADVYYFTPSGKKLRSVKEVLSYLTEDLTAENFTFLKEPLGVGDKEIVREAKPKGLIKGPEEGLVRKKSTPRVTKTAASPKTAKAIPQAESSSSSNKGSLTPRVVFKNTATIPKNKSPITTKSKPDIKKKKSESDDAEVPDGGDSEWNNSEPKANPTRDVCSIECRLAMGLIPTLQCHLCLCLYHPECVGLQEDKIKPARTYVCKNCQVLKKQMSPQFQPSVMSQSSSKVPSPPKKDVKIISVPRTQSIVGALTTWLPHSSSIQVSSGSNNNSNGGNTVSTNTSAAGASKTYSAGTVTTIAPFTNSGLTVTNNTIDAVPQSLLTLNGRAYVFVPKHNVVNVSNQSGGSSTTAQSSSGTAPGGHPSTGTGSAVVGGSDHYNSTGLTNLVPTAPGTFVVSTQAPPVNPHGLFLVPFPLQQTSTEPAHPQATIVNHSIQAVTPYTPGSHSLSNIQ